MLTPTERDALSILAHKPISCPRGVGFLKALESLQKRKLARHARMDDANWWLITPKGRTEYDALSKENVSA